MDVIDLIHASLNTISVGVHGSPVSSNDTSIVFERKRFHTRTLDGRKAESMCVDALGLVSG